MTERCGQPVTFPGVFSPVERDLGHPCVRAAGHDGPHRWQARWERVPPEHVEAEIAAFDAPDDDDDEPPGRA